MGQYLAVTTFLPFSPGYSLYPATSTPTSICAPSLAEDHDEGDGCHLVAARFLHLSPGYGLYPAFLVISYGLYPASRIPSHLLVAARFLHPSPGYGLYPASLVISYGLYHASRIPITVVKPLNVLLVHFVCKQS